MFGGSYKTFPQHIWAARNLQHPPENRCRQTCGSAQTKLFLVPSSLAHVKSGLDGNDDKSNQEFLDKELKNSTTGSLERLPYTALHSQCPAFSVVLLASQTFSSQVYSRFICSYHLTIKTSSSLLPDLNYPTHQRLVESHRLQQAPVAVSHSSVLAFELKCSKHQNPHDCPSETSYLKLLLVAQNMQPLIWTSELATRSSHSKWKPLNAECINMLSLSLQLRAVAARTCHEG